jgi:hypothetical protein
MLILLTDMNEESVGLDFHLSAYRRVGRNGRTTFLF